MSGRRARNFGGRGPALAAAAFALAGATSAHAAIFGVPVGAVLLTIWALNRCGPQDEGSRRTSSMPPSTGTAS